MAEISGAESADNWRDALAILAAVLADDDEGMAIVVLNSNLLALIGSFAAMIFGVLREHDIDPAAWVAVLQAHVNNEFGGNGEEPPPS